MSVTEDRQEDRTVLAGTDRGGVTAVIGSLGTNLIKLMCCNVVFVIFNIPAMAVAFLLAAYILPKMSSSLMPETFVDTLISLGLHGQTNRSNDITGQEAALSIYSLLLIFCVMLLVSSLLVCVGPVQAGLAKVYGSIARTGSESSVKVFLAGVKGSLRQSIPAMLISIAVTFICLLAVSFYLGFGLTPLAALFAVILVVFSLMQNLVYRIMVTSDLGLFKIYKNALFMMLLRLFPSIGMALLNIFVLAVIPFALIMSSQIVSVGVCFFLYLFILASLMHYLNTAYADSLIARYMREGEEDSDA
ncbi:MAG: hypothetical protein II667_06955 [Clostridiales bacterium]|nr:hypothetical protein [Clostridiales bacterium]